jgi:predicted AAA+ superfamily ATPase
VKEGIDAHRDRPGQYPLTGSQNILLVEEITESLAGRAAMLRLLPLSRREAEERSQATLPWEAQDQGDSEEEPAYREIWRDFLRGSYSELVANPGRDIHMWHSSYIQTYLERDVRSIRCAAVRLWLLKLLDKLYS